MGSYNLLSMMKIAMLFWIALVMSVLPCSSGIREGRDSYLDAYTATHGSSSPSHKYETPEIIYSSPEYESSSDSYEYPKTPTMHYYESPSEPTAPGVVYGSSVKPDYGASLKPVYGAPVNPEYGAPVKPVYGPPMKPVYGPPVTVVYEPPDNGSKGMQLGIDFATLCKILLKILIFKMIVKFIAVICVLLFLPKLDSGSGSSDGDSDNGRKIPSVIPGASENHLNFMTRVVLESVDKNLKLQIHKECDNDNVCTLKHVADYVDSYNSIPRLFMIFLTDTKKKS